MKAIDDIHAHMLADGVHQNCRDLSIVHGPGQKCQPHQSEDNGKVLFDAPKDDAESLSKIRCPIMIHSHELVLELGQECVISSAFRGPRCVIVEKQ